MAAGVANRRHLKFPNSCQINPNRLFSTQIVQGQRVNINKTMSGGDGYPSYYYHAQPSGSYPGNPNQSWNGWNLEAQYLQNYARSAEQNYARNSVTYHTNSLNHSNHSHSSHGSSHSSLRSQGYHSSTTPPNRSYYRNRYTNSNNQYSGNQQHGWQLRNQNSYKRSRLDSSESEPQLKTTKKKKKPLSQNIPNKKDWTIEEAERALATEKEYNKKSKYALIIKFPDQELNKDIVAKFHSSIDNVHFQQPCTPRFCFVTLQETANPEEVISVLNKQKFGDGFLTVEYKKDREEDQAINAEDIDPLTLYVGNLAQEITKDDMVTMYPNSKRIDIGFAKKMKFTRYAFVGFRTVTDSIEAFKKTHNQQMYNKSLIVRFRRLHGTVGMPGESKPQNPPKNKDDSLDGASVISDVVRNDARSEESTLSDKATKDTLDIPELVQSPPLSVPASPVEDVCSNHSAVSQVVNLERVKQEQPSPNDSEDEISSKSVVNQYRSPFLQANIDEYELNHRPKIKTEVKREVKNESNKAQTSHRDSGASRVKPEVVQERVGVKNEPCDDSSDDLDWNNFCCENGESDEDDVNNVSSSMTDFDSMYETMVNHANKINSLKKGGP